MTDTGDPASDRLAAALKIAILAAAEDGLEPDEILDEVVWALQEYAPEYEASS